MALAKYYKKGLTPKPTNYCKSCYKVFFKPKKSKVDSEFSITNISMVLFSKVNYFIKTFLSICKRKIIIMSNIPSL